MGFTEKTKYNAVKHSLTARKLINEWDEELFQEILENLCMQFEPKDYVQSILVDRMATCLWKLQKINGIQIADLLAYPIARKIIFPEGIHLSFELIEDKIYTKNGKKYGLKVYLCMNHHQYGPEAVHVNREIADLLKKTAEIIFIRIYGMDKWMAVFEINYLTDEEKQKIEVKKKGESFGVFPSIFQDRKEIFHKSERTSLLPPIS